MFTISTQEYRLYLADWLERLTVNAKVATVLGSIPSILRHSEIWGAADEAVLNNVHKKKKKKNTEQLSYLLLKKNVKLSME